ncbi:hypothetical protein RhiJN_08352 [Ceratobasidium sp. AG-Ba]|nr:hypothetical protein RhiJN_08352 [Ceratobasidium sp. AG-Ba]
MSRDISRGRWRVCIKNYGLPSCPPSISEPAYVSILFQSTCQVCGTHRPRAGFIFALPSMLQTMLSAAIDQVPQSRGCRCAKNRVLVEGTEEEMSEVDEATERFDELASDPVALSNWKKIKSKEAKQRKKI